ncbi:hypothetical protein BE20_44430 [Sorangium cellulosum]|nr:hypothetical protein BE20_44430 [Sorangium cellulosum]
MIAQTLHGYDHGHRLLASGGDLDDTELSLLDRLSDLSGYVPLDTEFDHYHTGFACGRYYAFACTWPDKAAVRAGTVLTHTLLVPRDGLNGIDDLWALTRWHRRPHFAVDRESYTAAIPADLKVEAATPPDPDPERARAAIALWFGQSDRPVLWVEDGRPDDIVRYLWGLLWPEARERFSFCTFALQVRHLRRQPFGFLALPPAARGAFHERVRSAAWWQDGHLSGAELRERSRQAWVLAILERGAEVTLSMPRFCAVNALPLLDEAQFPVFRRFLELERPASSRLTAARARADLLHRLWPELAPGHPLVQATLQTLLERQVDAPLSPRPFWELGDLLERPAVRALASADARFASALAETLANEVRRRLLAAPPDTVSGVATLPAYEPGHGLRGAILEAVASAFEGMPPGEVTEARASAVLLASPQAGESLLVHTVLAALPQVLRARTALRALQTVPGEVRPWLIDSLLNAARQLADPLLVAEVWLAKDEPMRGMREAAGLVLSAPEVDPELLRPVLARFSAEVRLAWALATAEPQLAAWAGARGAEAAQELRVPVHEVLERCRGAPNGARVLLACLSALPSSQLRDEELLSPAVAEMLATDAAGSPDAKRLVDHLTPRLVRQLSDDAWASRDASDWLRLAAIQDSLERSNPTALFSASGVDAADRDCLPNLARGVAGYVRSEPSAQMFWIPALLGLPLVEARPNSLSVAAGDLASVLALPHERRGWLLLAAHVLAAVRRTGCPAAHQLVELTFPVLYHYLERDRLAPGPRALLGGFRWYSWDLAKSWRHWLLDCWLEQRWPPAAFLRCMGQDEVLFRRLAHRAAKTWRGRELLFSLPGALAEDARLAERWTAPIAQVLSGRDGPLDYE